MDINPLPFLRRQVHARPLACFSLFFLTGIAIAHFCESANSFFIYGIIAASAGILLFFRDYRRTSLLIILAIGCGMLRMAFVTAIPSLTADRFSVTVSGKVTSDPYIKKDTGRLIFVLDVDCVDDIPEDILLRIYLRGDSTDLESIKCGQHLSISGHIWAPDPVTNPKGFDFGDYLGSKGISGYATAKIEDVRIISSDQDIHTVIIGIRNAISSRIDLIFPDNAPVVKALILADRSQIDDDTNNSFRDTGITHLICISGMHVSVLAMSILFVLRRIMNRRYAVAIALIFLILYGALIGFTVSFVRALIMFVIFSCAPIAGYPSDGITRLCFAMLITLVADPLQISDAGFVLSYSATAGIILLNAPLLDLFGITPYIHTKPRGGTTANLLHRVLIYFPQLLCATLSAQLATLPAVIAFYGIQSLVSVPVNLICVPLCMIAYPVSMVALITSYAFIPLGMWIAAVADALFSVLSFVAMSGAALPVTGVRIGKYAAVLVLLHCTVALSSSGMSRIPANIRRFLPLLLIPIAMLSSALVYLQGLGHTIVFLDAEQADCAVIRTDGKTYLVDVGDTYSPAPDYLDAYCLKLDGIFLSHPDEDHSGGLSDVLEIMRPDIIYVPSGWNECEDISQSVIDGVALATEYGIEIREISSGEAVTLSRNTTANVLAPEKNSPCNDSNAISMVFSVDHNGHTALFTGDLPIEYEPDIIPDADVLKVAHHGSDESTSQSFIDAASPEIAVISVGENNFGHPSDGVIQLLNKSGARVFRTDICGAITIRLDSDGTWHTQTYLPTEE